MKVKKTYRKMSHYGCYQGEDDCHKSLIVVYYPFDDSVNPVVEPTIISVPG